MGRYLMELLVVYLAKKVITNPICQSYHILIE